MLSDFVRIREESRTNTALIDPTTGQQTEINERGPHVSEQEIELFADKLLYLAKGASLCVFAGSLPRGVDVDIYGRLIREVTPPRRHHASSTRTATRCCAPSAPSPTSSRRTCSRPRSSSATSSTTTRTSVLAVREMVELGAREAIMTVPDGCIAQVAPDDGGQPQLLPRRRSRRVGGDGDDRLGRRVPGRLRRRALHGPRRRADCLAYGVACGAESTQHLGAGVVDPEAVDRLLGEVEVDASRPRAEFPQFAGKLRQPRC